MKVLVNGGLNLSELDGWWAEAYRPEVGWALGDGREHDARSRTGTPSKPSSSTICSSDKIVPEFYQRDAQGIPRAWVARIRESMASLTPAYSANRACASMSSDAICRPPQLTNNARKRAAHWVCKSRTGGTRWSRIGLRCGSVAFKRRRTEIGITLRRRFIWVRSPPRPCGSSCTRSHSRGVRLFARKWSGTTVHRTRRAPMSIFQACQRLGRLPTTRHASCHLPRCQGAVGGRVRAVAAMRFNRSEMVPERPADRRRRCEPCQLRH